MEATIIGYPTMQDYPSYTCLNSYDLEHLSNSTFGPWSVQNSNFLNDVKTDDETQPASLTDCLVTVSLMIFMLVSSSLLVGFAADQLTRGIVSLVQHQSDMELVAR